MGLRRLVSHIIMFSIWTSCVHLSIFYSCFVYLLLLNISFVGYVLIDVL